jgi:hypothetical protein
MIDYYGVTFDYLVSVDDTNPEVLQTNIVEIEDDADVYAIQYNNSLLTCGTALGSMR